MIRCSSLCAHHSQGNSGAILIFLLNDWRSSSTRLFTFIDRTIQNVEERDLFEILVREPRRELSPSQNILRHLHTTKEIHHEQRERVPRKLLLWHGSLHGTCEPTAMGYCHCESCRTWSAAQVNALTLWKPDAVQITQGAENIGTYSKTPLSYSQYGAPLH